MANDRTQITVDAGLNDNQLIGNDDTPTTKRFLGLEINPTVSRTAFMAFLLSALFSICFFVFLNAAQTFVLAEVLNISTLGSTGGSLAFYDEILSIFLVSLWGTLSDKVGRRLVNVLGYLIMGVGLMVFPLANNVYPQLLLARLFFAIGAAATSSMLTALVGDYGGQSKGKISGVVGLFTGLGALLAVFGFLPMVSGLSASDSTTLTAALRRAFLVVGAVAMVVGVVLFFTLQNDTNRGIRVWYQSRGQPKEDEEQKQLPQDSLFVLLKRGILAGRNPKIALAYLSGMAARADSIIVSLFIATWINQWYIFSGSCPLTDAEAVSSVVKENCRAAYTYTSAITGVAQVCALIAAPVFGYFSDKVEKSLLVTIAGLLGVIAFVGISLIKEATSKVSYVFAIFIGLAQIGMIVTSLALVNENVDPEIRGSVAGVYSAFGGFGIMFITKVGGTLFDQSPASPFIIMAVVHGLIMVLAAAIYVQTTRHSKQTANGPDSDKAIEEVLQDVDVKV